MSFQEYKYFLHVKLYTILRMTEAELIILIGSFVLRGVRCAHFPINMVNACEFNGQTILHYFSSLLGTQFLEHLG